MIVAQCKLGIDAQAFAYVYMVLLIETERLGKKYRIGVEPYIKPVRFEYACRSYLDGGFLVLVAEYEICCERIVYKIAVQHGVVALFLVLRVERCAAHSGVISYPVILLSCENPYGVEVQVALLETVYATAYVQSCDSVRVDVHPHEVCRHTLHGKEVRQHVVASATEREAQLGQQMLVVLHVVYRILVLECVQEQGACLFE